MWPSHSGHLTLTAVSWTTLLRRSIAFRISWVNIGDMSRSPRGDEQTSMFGAPARAEVGAQMYNQAINTVMVAKVCQGNEKIEDVIKWAEKELEGTLRA